MICAVLFSETVAGLKGQLQTAIAGGIQIIEFRIDGLIEFDLSELKDLLKENPLPSILSLRSEWKNTLITPPSQGRRNLLRLLLTLEPDYLDLEFPNDIPLIQEASSNTGLIISLIDFEGMAKISIDSAIDIAKNHHNMIIKISATPISVAELKQMWSWAGKLQKAKIPHVIVGMGELGKLTRIKSNEIGNQWMYGKMGIEIGEPFLPGMMPISTLKDAYAEDAWHLANISKTSSRDMLNLFQRILESSSLIGIHMDLPIQTYPELDQLLLWIQDGLLDGLYVQDPWQVEIIPKLNNLDVSVINVGRCNCVKITKNGLKGYNTLVEGIRRTLVPYSIKKLKRIYIEGTNHLARAAISALTEDAELIVVRGRYEEEVNRLKSEFPYIRISDNSFTDHFDLVINCEATDMGFENVLTLPRSTFESCSVVLNTQIESNSYLEKISIQSQKHYISGNNLLLNSAIYAFELWTNRSVPISNLRGPMNNPD